MELRKFLPATIVALLSATAVYTAVEPPRPGHGTEGLPHLMKREVCATGSSESYFHESLARDLAETNCLNKLNRQCASSYISKSQVRWGYRPVNCPANRDGEVKCTQDCCATCPI